MNHVKLSLLRTDNSVAHLAGVKLSKWIIDSLLKNACSLFLPLETIFFIFLSLTLPNRQFLEFRVRADAFSMVTYVQLGSNGLLLPFRSLESWKNIKPKFCSLI